METFLRDYDLGKEQGRYVAAEAPFLPSRDNAFDISLCSHFLLLYGQQLSFDFHLASILELLRVSHEVRIFPTAELKNRPSRHLAKIAKALEEIGHSVGLLPSKY